MKKAGDLLSDPAIGKVFLREEEIQAKVRELGEQVSTDYADKCPVLVSVLKGGFVFLADLIRAITIPNEIDFMLVSSYESTKSSGIVRILSDLSLSIEDRHVIIVEDIVDTGLTLNYLISVLQGRKPATLEICAMLEKDIQREPPIDIKYLGFKIPNEFVIGYGLDLDQQYRGLPYVALLQGES